MVSLNKVMLIGNVGKDAEMRFTPNGKPITSFSVACNHIFTTAEGEKREETDWFDVICWDKLAETTNQYVTKGMQVYVEGRMHRRAWDDATTGEKRVRYEIVANTVLFLGIKQSVNEGAGAGGDESKTEEIPFS